MKGQEKEREFAETKLCVNFGFRLTGEGPRCIGKERN